MSACTIPFEAEGKAKVGKRKADGMTTEIKSLGFRPPLSTFRFSKAAAGGVLKKAGGFSTQVTTRGPGGLLNNRGGFSTDLRLG